MPSLLAPAYPYQQFNDDADIVALFSSYNQLANTILDWLLSRPLACYMRESISAGLLDYAAYCIYGVRRYQIGYSNIDTISGAIDTITINQLPIDGNAIAVHAGSTKLSDDIFKRILTWNFYRGDGTQFSIPWLKKRIMRFLTGTQGRAWRFNGTLPVSVIVQNSIVTIQVAHGVATSELIQTLNILLRNGIVHVPSALTYNITEI